MSASRPSSIETEDNSSENLKNVVKDPTHRVTRAQLLTMAGAGVPLAAWPDMAGATSAQGRLEFPFYPRVQGTYTNPV